MKKTIAFLCLFMVGCSSAPKVSGPSDYNCTAVSGNKELGTAKVKKALDQKSAEQAAWISFWIWASLSGKNIPQGTKMSCTKE